MKIALKSVALCSFLFKMMHNECSAMQAIADEIRKGERERVERERKLSANPPPISSSSKEEIPETIEKESDSTLLPEVNLPKDHTTTKIKSPPKQSTQRTPDKSPPKEEFKQQIKYIGGQRIVTPGKKPEEKK